MLNYASIANLEKFSRVFGAGYVVDNEQKYSSKTIYWPIRTWRPTSGQTLTVATAAGAQALGHSCCVVSVEGARIHAGDCSASRWNKQGPLFQCVKTCVEQSLRVWNRVPIVLGHHLKPATTTPPTAPPSLLRPVDAEASHQFVQRCSLFSEAY